MLGLERSPKVLAGDADYGVTVAVDALTRRVTIHAIRMVTP